MKFTKKHSYILIILIFISYVGSTYNSLTVKLNNIDRTLAEIENNMQSRLDTFSSLVETTKESVEFESSTLEKVTQFRSGIQNAGDRNAKIAALNNANSGFSGIMATFENYPTLQTTQQFASFQTEIRGMENRLRVARKNFNDATFIYNNIVERIPSSIIANLFKFSTLEYFEAEQAAQSRPNLTELFDQ